MTSLKTEIEKFKTWASQYPESDRYGEWECDYPGWTLLYKTFIRFLAETDFRQWDEATRRDVLYLIARDNEIEKLVAALAEDTARLLSIVPFALKEAEPEAKWQLAIRLGNVQSQSAQAEEYLLAFMRDSDEYVRRRALMALAQLGSLHTEALCAEAWATRHEYQRIAVLHALHTIGSPDLKRYITFAKEDGREYLMANARQLE